MAKNNLKPYSVESNQISKMKIQFGSMDEVRTRAGIAQVISFSDANGT